VQAFQGQAAQHFIGLEAQHLLGAGIERIDHAAQVGGNDRHLGRRVQHAAQLTMGAAQLKLAQAQLLGALLDHFQRALTLADQHIQQRAEQQAEQAAHGQDRVHRRVVGLVEHLARLQAQGVDVIAQGQPARGGQVAAAWCIAGCIKHALLGVGGVDDLHHQVVAVGFGQAIGHQLPHADHRHHEAIGLGLGLLAVRQLADGGYQQYASGIGRFHPHQLHGLRHRHLAGL
ncbi:hypothetical protein OJ15_14755, partial [Listeria monocytogenes]